ncbi:hypothetical protein MTBBW1_20047 [Desulfamplus magnetovallimortis]|uniref:4Fe-4S ferredoxin-type domain-containing protein n=1 Tax=Desulfamplus magnetovallimortis TaxID=1246637 RepID=A0A1W1HBJ6_9BACT|nr:4Fe-4S binding protein [Desulfamplus magnetovallimortis]SLM29850.1 hypothetical protein MTBBW1_20047 [Desulfamplus magnetovallimortis]
MTPDIKKFISLFEIPPAIQPYVEVFAEPLEIELIVTMNGTVMKPEEVAERLSMDLQQASDFLEKCYYKHFVHRVVDGKKVGYVFDHVDTAGKSVAYMPARFTDRLDELTMYGNWDDIPEDVRQEITDWWLDDYVKKVSPVVENIKKDPDAYQQIKQKDFLLLEEALEQVEKAEVHAVVNCDCRSSTQGCNRMVEACIRLDDGARYTLERGLGRKLTREECKSVVLKTDREGLMHIGTLPHEGKGLFGFCNCCTCCCFPVRASERLDSDRIYPRVHYVASRNDDTCIHCGICVKRCQYNAFYHDGSDVIVKLEKNSKKCTENTETKSTENTETKSRGNTVTKSRGNTVTKSRENAETKRREKVEIKSKDSSESSIIINKKATKDNKDFKLKKEKLCFLIRQDAMDAVCVVPDAPMTALR